MRVGFISTGTNNIMAVINSAKCIPQFKSIEVLIFSHIKRRAQNPSILTWAIKEKFDVIFFIGSAAGTDPFVGDFRLIRQKVCPVYHLCFDGGDKPWWNRLEMYKKENCFDKQINIDGLKENPCDVTTICPLNPDDFNPNTNKTIPFGFAGNIKSAIRTNLVTRLVQANYLTLRVRDQNDNSFAEYCNFLNSCKGMLNISYTGTGKAHHVKARILEGMYAGCVLVEDERSPTKEYFIPGIDYLPYDGTYDGVLRAINATGSMFTKRIREKAVELYGPKAFYKLVLGDRLQ